MKLKIINSQKSIDEINSRLISIESLVKTLSISDGPQPGYRRGESPQATGPLFPGPAVKGKGSPDGSTGTSQTPGPSSFEGDSSFATQTVLAGELVGNAASRTQQSIEILDALSSLKELMNASSLDGCSTGFDDLYFEADEKPKGLPPMELLPAQFVIALLRKLKGKYPHLNVFIIKP
ncbi:hypothetical protein ABW19_dt0206400 [Dactylella cylindrospora]|nr:hypothetical protein ABW19_dt0206400 [Dactylella cylindrospora]